MRTANQRHTLDEELRTAGAETSRRPANPSTLLSADVADHVSPPRYSAYTVRTTSFLVGPILPTTTAVSPSNVSPSTKYFHSFVRWSLCLSTIRPLRMTCSTSYTFSPSA